MLRELYPVIRDKLYRWTLRTARLILDAADEWIHAREVRLRDKAAAVDNSAVALAEVDPVASRAREKALRKPARARIPRLQYAHGVWVTK